MFRLFIILSFLFSYQVNADAYNTAGNSTTESDGSGTDQAAGRYDGDDLFMKYRWALNKPFTPEFGKLSNMTIAFDLSEGLEYQIIKPFRISFGPYQLKKTCPIPVIKTGKEPASRAKANLFLDFVVIK